MVKLVFKTWVGCGHGSRVVFKAPERPTKERYKMFKRVIGPFRTLQAAYLMAQPFYQGTIRDAEMEASA